MTSPLHPASSLCLTVIICTTACLEFEEDCFQNPNLPECQDTGGGPPANGVEGVLDDLGITRSSEARVDEEGDALSDEYAPLGSRRTINRFSEILFFGAQLDDATMSQGRMPVLDIDPSPNNTFSWSLIDDAELSETPWLVDDRQTPRAAVEGDFDGDGQDEVAVAYQLTSEPVRVVIMDGAPDYTFGAPIVVDTNTWRSISVASGDFDGNGSIDLAFGLVGEGDAILTRLLNTEGGFRPDGQAFDVEGVRPGTRELILESGNVDFDAAQELAVVANGYDDGASRYFVFDDARRAYAELASGLTSAFTGSVTETAVVADISLGDVDGDGLDEVVVGGLDRTGTVRQEIVRYVLQVLDDGDRAFAELATLGVNSGAERLRPTSSGASHRLSFMHVLTADLDGDGAKEIVSNQLVYEDLRQSPGALVPFDIGEGPIEIPIKDLFTDGDSGDDYSFTSGSSSMAAGDVTSDRRENIVLYAQRLDVNGEGMELQVWGVDGIDGWKEMLDIETRFSNPLNNGGELRAQIILTDSEVDNASMALEYSEGSYRYVFTEPVVLAALASAPCSTSLGQDVGASCKTAFGQAISETVERESSLSVTAGVSAGFEGDIPFVGSAEAVVDLSLTVQQTTTNAYQLTTSVLRETGSLEDSVIFTTIPLDIYTYTVLSHPNPDLIGERIEVRLPREPITVMVEASVYNAAIEEGGVAIDERIFSHTAGDPSTYKTRVAKDQLLSRFPGVESDPVDVGQGSGQTILSITDFSSTTNGTAYDFEASLNVKVTAGGVVAGYTVGSGAGSALRVTRGSETIYQGSVGNISEEFFPMGSYSWGLFSYIYEDDATGQTFEVLDYWVD